MTDTNRRIKAIKPRTRLNWQQEEELHKLKRKGEDRKRIRKESKALFTEE